MPESPEVIAGRYRIVRRIGRGGMGVVYQVVDERTKQGLAMKLMGSSSDALVERFRRESAALLRIKSEHVVRVYDADVARELGGVPYIVMEHLRGRDLATWLAERKRFTPREVVTLLLQAARGVARAHELGIVHRDLKPENLFLHEDPDGRRIVKVLDFGLARMLESRAKRITLTGETLGTPLYMAPEQIRADGVIGPATDVWAFGVIAHEMLTGVPYFERASVPGVLSAILRDAIVPPTARWPHLPKAFDEWFLRSCARDASTRWPSVRVQLEALAAALEVEVVAAPAPPPPRRRDSPLPRAAAALAAAALALGGLVVCAEPGPAAIAPVAIVVSPQQDADAPPIVEAPSPAPAPIAPPPPPDPDPAPVASAATPSCDPSYTFDTNGHRHFKPECITISSTIQAPVAPTGVGYVTIICLPVCDSVVLDGGASIGATPIPRRAVATGRHIVTLTSGPLKKTLTFIARPGETTALRIAMQ